MIQDAYSQKILELCLQRKIEEEVRRISALRTIRQKAITMILLQQELHRQQSIGEKKNHLPVDGLLPNTMSERNGNDNPNHSTNTQHPLVVPSAAIASKPQPNTMDADALSHATCAPQVVKSQPQIPPELETCPSSVSIRQSIPPSAMGSGSAPKPKKTKSKRRKAKTFEEHFQNLIKFKELYGHCNVPHRSKDFPALGTWCNNIRTSRRIMREGGDPASYKLSCYQVKQLEKVGFRWNIYKTARTLYK